MNLSCRSKVAANLSEPGQFKIYISNSKRIMLMVEKMTAVWLIIITIIACSAVPGVLIYLTAIPHAKLLTGFQLLDATAHVISIGQ